MLASVISFALGLGVMYGYVTFNQSVREQTTLELMELLWQRHATYIVAIGVYLGLLHLYLIWKIIKWFFRGAKKYVEVVQHDASSIVGSISPIYLPEKTMPGSEWFKHNRPTHQVEIRAELTPGTWTLQGAGFRMRDFLVTAAHVVEGHDKLRIRAGDNFVDVETRDFKYPAETGSDLAVMLLSSVQWSTLQVKQAKIPKIAVNNPTAAFVYHDGLATTGLVTPHRSAPYVIYSGTTRGGCSGAPLGTGNTVYAMVLGAADVNLALDANWIQAMAFTGESTEDILYRELENMAQRSGRKIPYKMFNPGEAVVLARGRYELLDIEQIPDRIKELLEYDDGTDRYTKYSASTGAVDLPSPAISSRITYNDNDAFLDLRSPGVIAGAKQLKKDCVVPSTSQVEVLPPSNSHNPLPVTDGQQQILALLREVSATISKSPERTSGNPAVNTDGQPLSIRKNLLKA
nr:hypothetical protein [Solemoviridae sp.]